MQSCYEGVYWDHLQCQGYCNHQHNLEGGPGIPHKQVWIPSMGWVWIDIDGNPI